MSTIKILIESPVNISFRELVETGIEPAEWDQMDDATQNRVIDDAIWSVLDVAAVEEE